MLIVCHLHIQDDVTAGTRTTQFAKIIQIDSKQEWR